MSSPEQIADEMRPDTCGCCSAGAEMTGHIRKLQVATLVWMLAECAIALTAAWRAQSPVLLAFGADSFVELTSAAVVLLQFVPRFTLSESRAARLAGILLFALAGIVAFASLFALWQDVRPETSWMGIGITIAALFVMPVLSSAKRRAANTIGNLALGADAVQSATCAYLAAVTLAGLALNAAFHVGWIDPLAALVAVPIICIEGKRALKGTPCHC